MTSGVLLTPAPRQAEGKQEEQDRAAQLQAMVHHLRHAQAALSEAQLDQANVHDLKGQLEEVGASLLLKGACFATRPSLAALLLLCPVVPCNSLRRCVRSCGEA